MNFWKSGLQFSCKRCSHCCRHEPGYVFLSARDIRELMAELGLGLKEFLRLYTRTVDMGTGWSLSLKELPGNDCIFWKEGCTVYKARPVQCISYPFWSSILVDKSEWEYEAKDCPGIGNGKLVVPHEIQKMLDLRKEHPTIIFPYSIDRNKLDELTVFAFPQADSVKGETEFDF